jgi:hypothetical protein
MSEKVATITREQALEILVGIARVEFSREDGLALLMRIATDRKNDMRDRLEAIRVHSKMSGFRLTEGEIWSVIAALANGDALEFAE